MKRPYNYILKATILVYDPQKRWNNYPEDNPVIYLDQKMVTLEFPTFKKAKEAIPAIEGQYRDYHNYEIFSIRIDKYCMLDGLSAEKPMQTWMYKHKDEALERYEYQDGAPVGHNLPYHNFDIVEMVIDNHTKRLGIIIGNTTNDHTYKVITGSETEDIIECHPMNMREFFGWLGAVNFMYAYYGFHQL